MEQKHSKFTLSPNMSSINVICVWLRSNKEQPINWLVTLSSNALKQEKSYLVESVPWIKQQTFVVRIKQRWVIKSVLCCQQQQVIYYIGDFNKIAPLLKVLKPETWENVFMCTHDKVKGLVFSLFTCLVFACQDLGLGPLPCWYFSSDCQCV